MLLSNWTANRPTPFGQPPDVRVSVKVPHSICEAMSSNENSIRTIVASTFSEALISSAQWGPTHEKLAQLP